MNINFWLKYDLFQWNNGMCANHFHLNEFQQNLLTAVKQWLTTLTIHGHGVEQSLQLEHILHHRLSQYGNLNHQNFQCHQAVSSGKLTNGSQIIADVFIKWQYVSAYANMPVEFNMDLNAEIRTLNALCHFKPKQDRLRLLLPCHCQSDVPFMAGLKATPQNIGRLSVMVLPFFKMGNLKQLYAQEKINSKQYTDTDKKALNQYVIKQAALALQQIHQAGFIHGDVKPSNFLLKHTNALPVLYLTDFALSQPIFKTAMQSYQVSKQIATIGGTPAYFAPECWAGTDISIASDIYAFGLMVYELLTGTKAGQKQLMTYAKNTQDCKQRSQAWANWHAKADKGMPKLPKNYQSWQAFITACTQYHVNKRPQNMQAVIELMPIH